MLQLAHNHRIVRLEGLLFMTLKYVAHGPFTCVLTQDAYLDTALRRERSTGTSQTLISKYDRIENGHYEKYATHGYKDSQKDEDPRCRINGQ